MHIADQFIETLLIAGATVTFSTMSMADIEAELDRLTADELRELAMKSWAAFVTKESGRNEFVEEDPQVIAAVEDAIKKAEAPGHKWYTADEVRARLKQWTSR